MTVRKMEQPTTDFQICILLFPVVSVMHNLHRQESIWSWLFFSFCLFSFSCSRAGTPESWDKSPTLLWCGEHDMEDGEELKVQPWGLSWILPAAIKKALSCLFPVLKRRNVRVTVCNAQWCWGQSQSQSPRYLPTPRTMAINCWLQPIL